ncbi:MAG: hypothetical protein ACO3EE_08175 [Flavobacteriales bacterium]
MLLSEANGIERQLQPSFYVSPEEYFDGFADWRNEDNLHKEMHYAGRFFTEIYYRVFYFIHLMEKTPKSELAKNIQDLTTTSDYIKYTSLQSVRIQTLHLKIKLYESFMKNNKKEFHARSKDLLKYYSNKNIAKIYLPATLIGLINNLALVALMIGDEDVFNDSLDMLHQKKLQLIDTSESSVIMADNCATYLSSYYFIKKGWFSKGIDLCKLKLNSSDEIIDDAMNENRATLFYYQSVFLFLEGRFSEAIKSLNAIDLYTEKHTSTGMESESLLIKILCHIELGNYDSADYLAKKYNNFLEKKAPNFKQRIAFLKALSKLSNVSKDNLAKAYQVIAGDLKDEDQLVGVFLIDLNLWVKSVLEKSEVSKLYQEKFEQLKKEFN